MNRPTTLTPEQRRIVEWGNGPAVVIAGAGTGKTRVTVERVRHLLETRPDLMPEELLVLTYNVKAARELQERIDRAVGVATRSRMTVTNFHSFCQRILTENAADLITALHRTAQRRLPVILVGAGLPQLRGRTGRAKSYAERLFDFPEVGPLTPEAAKSAILKPALDQGVDVTPGSAGSDRRRDTGLSLLPPGVGETCLGCG